MSHVTDARKYARGVVAGRIPACQWTRLACRRELEDQKRWKGKGKTYWFDTAAAERACRAVELFRHTKGEWARRDETITLEPWQKFILTTVFGWKRRDGYRRYRTVYIEVPRKNAKSTLSSAVGLYMLGPDDEPGAEVYSAATARHQARIVFEDAQKMARRDPEFRERYGIRVGAHNIHILERGSKFEALSTDDKSLEGLNVHCGIVDEIHAHKDRKVWDVLEAATGSRSQPLIWGITTAGNNRVGICYEQRSYVIKILEGVHRDETYFGIIYTIDDGDDWTKEEAWAKANPNLGVSLHVDDIARLCTKAEQLPASRNNFLTKRLNVWVNADVGVFDMTAWKKCTQPELSMSDFEGERCWVAIDLASSDDIACVAFWFTRRGQHYVFLRHYLPEETVQAPGNDHYAGWELEDRIIQTDGATTDYATIEDDLLEASTRFQIQQIGGDPWQSTYLMQRLEARGADVVEVRQTVGNFSEPFKDIIGLHKDRKMHHDGDPVLEWMVSNTVGHYDVKENIYPRKERPENKIDGVVAMIMARNLAMRAKQKRKSIYAERGLRSI